MKTGIIYCWTNKKNGKKYVGQTIRPTQRIKNHLHEALVKGSDFYFHRALRKYGSDGFEYEILEESVNRKSLNDRENHYINEFGTIWPGGYNQCTAGCISKTSVEKMSATKKKQYAAMSSEERKSLTRNMCEGNVGRKHSDEAKRKRSESMKKYLKENPRVLSEETKRKIAESVSKTRKEKFQSNKRGGD